MQNSPWWTCFSCNSSRAIPPQRSVPFVLNLAFYGLKMPFPFAIWTLPQKFQIFLIQFPLKPFMKVELLKLSLHSAFHGKNHLVLFFFWPFAALLKSASFLTTLFSLYYIEEVRCLEISSPLVHTFGFEIPLEKFISFCVFIIRPIRRNYKME